MDVSKDTTVVDDKIIDDRIIDNKEIILQDQLQDILRETKRANIAVGYFFISGFAKIVDYFGKINSSKNEKDVVRILISPTTDKKTAEALIEGLEQAEAVKKEVRLNGMPSKEEKTKITHDTENTIDRSLQFMAQTQSDQEVTNKLIWMMKNNKMEVRVYTKERLHAKAYIFELDNSQVKAVGIVGSSNLSISGISEHSELNLKTRDPHDAMKLLKWFDEHWADGVPFTKEMADILERSWAGRQRNPVDIYHKAIVHEFGDKFDPRKTKAIDETNIIKLFDFQKHAVVDALSALDKYDGAIIADVVGMGKTFVGSTILKYLQERDRRKPLIICPPHLQSMWNEFCLNNDINAEIISRGKLGRGNFRLDKYISCDVVLLDESHNFRNSGTNSYDALSSFMDRSQAKMIMLTATPLSNKPSDIKNQLKLFPGGDATKIHPASETGLDQFFRNNFSRDEMSDKGRDQLRELLQHVMIRRTRRYIKNEYAQMDDTGRHYLLVGDERKYFPEREMENPDPYDIDKVYNKKYEYIESLLSGNALKLARYTPAIYLRNEYIDDPLYSELRASPTAMSGIMRISLLKRMESSVKAFKTSIEHYRKGHIVFLELLKQGTMPIGKNFAGEIYERIARDDDYDGISEDDDLRSIRSKYSIDAFDVEAMKRDIMNDISIFSAIEGFLNYDFDEYDDKLHKLADIIRTNRGKKTLVFTESAVTAKYISKYIKENVNGMSNKMDEIDSNTKNKMDLIRRFDPVNNPGPNIPKPKQIDLLISTDVLSEGVNLQIGQMVINYDFHWNPVKLIQRVGRVDRLGSEHEKINIVNFLSNPRMDQDSSLRKIVENKIKRIHEIIGSDYAILHKNEVINEKDIFAVYAERNDNILDIDTGLVFEPSKFEGDVRKITRENAARQKEIANMPYGLRSAVSKSGPLLIACEASSFFGSEQLPDFRRYYEIRDGTVTAVSSNKLLLKMRSNTKMKSVPQSKEYNKIVALAWVQFCTDMRSTCARKPPKQSYQKWFKEKLEHVARAMEKRKTIAELVDIDVFANWKELGRRADVNEMAKHLSDLQKFCLSSIYGGIVDAKLKNLRNRARGNLSNAQLIADLSEIYETHGDSVRQNSTRTMTRPRILYSMMVKK